ncbi:MAG: hypothetical protein ACK6DN_17110, partial [Planctomycetota bacterium]
YWRRMRLKKPFQWAPLMHSRLPVVFPILASLAFAPNTDFWEWMLPNFSKLEAKIESFNSGEVVLVDRGGKTKFLPLREFRPDDWLASVPASSLEIKASNFHDNRQSNHRSF